MRHGDKQNNLGRKKGHRDALLKNLACSLVEHKRIFTTLAKARALRGFIEPLITKSKNNTTHSRRVVFSYLQNKEAIKELFGSIADKVATRPGGYVRIIKTGFRKGDGADMAMIELVDFNDLLVAKTGSSTSTTKKRTRRSSGAKKSTENVAPVQDVVTAPVEEVETVAEMAENQIEEVENVVDTVEDVVENNDQPTTEEEPKQDA